MVDTITEDRAEQLPIVLSTDEAASLLGVCRRTVQRMIRRGEIKSRRLGRRWVIATSDLLEACGINRGSD